MTFRLLALLLPLLAFVFAPPARAISEIKLLVNGKPISNFDIDQQAKMLVITSNIKPTKANLARARVRAKAQLVDNILRLDAARGKNISATPKEVEETILRGLRPGSQVEEFLAFLESNNIRRENFYRHMRAELLWNKYVQREILPRINVPQGDVQQQIEKIKQSLEQQTFLLSQIVLRFNNPNEEKKIRATAAALKQQLNRGADFASLARNYSQGSKATSGGDLGWTAENNLPKLLRRVVVDMKRGKVSPVIRLPDGYYLLKLRDISAPSTERAQQTMLDLKVVRLPTQTPMAKMKAAMPACDKARPFIEKLGGEVEPMGLTPMKDLAAPLQKKLRLAADNTLVPTSQDKDWLEFFMLCGRSVQRNPKLSQARVENKILSELAFIRARQKLRDLRRNASIETK